MDVAVGQFHAVALTDEGEVWGWGCAQYIQPNCSLGPVAAVLSNLRAKFGMSGGHEPGFLEGPTLLSCFPQNLPISGFACGYSQVRGKAYCNGLKLSWRLSF